MVSRSPWAFIRLSCWVLVRRPSASTKPSCSLRSSSALCLRARSSVSARRSRNTLSRLWAFCCIAVSMSSLASTDCMRASVSASAAESDFSRSSKTLNSSLPTTSLSEAARRASSSERPWDSSLAVSRTKSSRDAEAAARSCVALRAMPSMRATASSARCICSRPSASLATCASMAHTIWLRRAVSATAWSTACRCVSSALVLSDTCSARACSEVMRFSVSLLSSCNCASDSKRVSTSFAAATAVSESVRASRATSRTWRTSSRKPASALRKSASSACKACAPSMDCCSVSLDMRSCDCAVWRSSCSWRSPDNAACVSRACAPRSSSALRCAWMCPSGSSSAFADCSASATWAIRSAMRSSSFSTRPMRSS